MINNEPVIDMDELTNYIFEKVDISVEAIGSIFDAELKFYELKGLALDEIPEEEDFEPVQIDIKDEIEFICQETKLDPKVIDVVLEHEQKYIEKHGIIG